MEMPQISLEERKDVITLSYSYFENRNKKKDSNQKQTSISEFMNK